MMNQIYYRGGYKYQLAVPYSLQTDIKPPEDVLSPTGLFGLTVEGLLWINANYAWDGATCCPDFRSIRRGSLMHDVLYQMLRDGMLEKRYRKAADALLRKLCIEDGMLTSLAWIVWQAVKIAGAACATPGKVKEILTAP